MALDVTTVQDAIVQVLKDNTLTMAASITASGINTIAGGDARSRPQAIESYPAILVKLLREDEEFGQIGQRNNEHTLEWLIVPLLYESKSTEQSDKDIMTLTKNVKSVLKSNINLSSTALWSLPVSVDYAPVDLDGVYCSAAFITFQSRHLST